MKPRNPTGPANPEDIAQRRFHATRCAWTTNNRQCLLTGSSSPDTGGITGADDVVRSPRSFCPFHRECLDHGAVADSRGFDAWLEARLEQFPARLYGHSEWTRFGSEALWQAAIGNERVPTLTQPPRDPNGGRPASAQARREAFRIVAELGAKVGAR